MRFFVLCFISMFTGALRVQSQSNAAMQLLERIAKDQVPQDNGYYYAGSFPTYRHYLYTNNVKHDNNGFFAGLIVMTLRDLLPLMHIEERAVAESIIQKTLPVFAHYQDKKNGPIYNFWPIGSPAYPNSVWAKAFPSNSLCNDIDDTAIMLLAMNANDSSISAAKKFMVQFVNGKHKRIKNTYRRYKNIPAYSTWAGPRMPIDFDFAVLCNVLYLSKKNNVAFNTADSASLQLVEQIIREREYVKHPAYISPHYGNTALLLYHLARLHTADASLFAAHLPQLIKDALNALQHAENETEKAMLQSALIKLGYPVTALSNVPVISAANDRFVFFKASTSSLLSDPFRRFFLHSKLIQFNFISPGYNDVLLLENVLLRRK